MAGFISPLLGNVRVSKTGTGSRTGPSGLLLRSYLALVSLVWPWAFGARDWSVSVIVISPADEWQAHSECQLWLLSQGGCGLSSVPLHGPDPAAYGQEHYPMPSPSLSICLVPPIVLLPCSSSSPTSRWPGASPETLYGIAAVYVNSCVCMCQMRQGFSV